ncbi:hypothetical protein OOT46_16800 [Aquabacterium sp. A7-Y]|uniref:hypothetical protein n=1 Tax=Aquabacterium sp. A7-Y TaxID=1349605 RepID=UPI00223E1D58|nr:hypothetical protein [Aquabacterium sp. A7-Y]MCW7539503.1 hypothetical protein [Aquabacterium sp. A7-Y]
MIDIGPRLAGLDSTEDYLIDEHLNYMYEVDTAHVLPLLPPPLSPKEPRPGKSLINVGYMKFDGTQIGGLRDTIELTLSIVINPDLSLDMPVPRMCVYDFRIASNCPVFLAHEDEIQKLRGMHLPGLSRRFDDSGHRLEVWDDTGPIFTFLNPNPDPVYKFEQATGQYVSRHPDGLYQGVFFWEGVGCEQQWDGDCGTLHPHPFYQEIDVAWAESCFVQMFLPRPTQVLFRSFVPRRIA